MSQLTDQYFAETHLFAILQRGSGVYHTPEYVNWLERLVEGVPVQPPNKQSMAALDSIILEWCSDHGILSSKSVRAKLIKRLNAGK